jgi:threonine dehydratase
MNTNLNKFEISDPIIPTHVMQDTHLNQLTGCEIYLISELCQVTGSFKFRAAWNVVNQIDAPGFIAASSGNFGQALACAAKMRGRQCTIVMPDSSARIKVEAVRHYGATVDLVDVRNISREQRVSDLSKSFPDHYVSSAYDSEHVISGNASLGIELANSVPDIDAIIVPIGGGGLSAGIISGLRSRDVGTLVWGAEPAIANDAARSLRYGMIISNEKEPDTLADGARTISLGRLNFDILSHEMSGVIEIEESLISIAMKHLHQCGLRVEPTGALSVAALFANAKPFRDLKIGCVLSGGNVDDDVYCNLVGL